MRIHTAAVLGAGVMGAQIAAHLANAGVRVRLLDISRDAAREGLERAKRLKPDPFFTPDAAGLIQTGSFDEDLALVRDAEWILEAIVEQLEPKRALLARVEPLRRENAIVSSNTSGIPIASIAEGRSEGFRRRWIGTHFFNPPRYLHLVELIPTAETDPAVVATLSEFCDVRLGKGVVVAKDAPGFIGNRIAMFGMVQALQAVASGEYTIEEVDAITGPAIGRPKSATFRTADIAGVDVVAHVARTLAERLDDEEERRAFVLPPFVSEMVARGMTGAKAGRGFYQKRGDEILTLDPKTLAHRPPQPPKLAALESARMVEPTGKRIEVLYNGKDRVGELVRRVVASVAEYAARVAPQIAYSAEDIDRAMRWGFGWELGPFETTRAVGLDLGTDAGHLPTDVGHLFRGAAAEAPLKRRPTAIRTSDAKVVKKNAGASLVDLGDGVLCVAFHSKMNAIGGDTIEMIRAGVKEASENFAALVIGNDGANFSAGANLMLLLLEAQEGNWDEVDLMVRAFQGATMSLKYADVPVVVAPAGLTLGGGCEIVLHAARVQAAAESYIGLVEVGVGLIPAGGGTKEMLARAMDEAPAGRDVLPYVQRTFETIGFAKVSTSAPGAMRLEYLRDGDEITMNRDRLLEDAKAHALVLARDFTPQLPHEAIRVGGEDVFATLKLGVHLAWRAGRISDHDALIGRKLAWILAGGNLAHPGAVSEQQLLDLEREAFLSLCGERKTLERIAYTLKTGKTLRN